MGIEISKLFVTISADLTSFRKNIKGIKPEMDKIALGAGLVGGAIIAGFGMATKQFAQTADDLDEMSQRTGMSTTALQKLGYAAKLSGGSLDGLEGSVKKMQMYLHAASQEGGGTSSALKQLGLDIKNLQGLKPEDQFMAIAEALATIEDPTTRAALAVEVFGRSGTDLLPILADGKQGLKDMQNEAQELGNIMGEDTVKKGAELNDTLDKLDMSMKALQNSIGAALAPELTKFVDKLVIVIGTMTQWLALNPQVIRWIGVLGAALVGFALAWKAVGIASSIAMAMTGPWGIAMVAAGLLAAVGAAYAINKLFESQAKIPSFATGGIVGGAIGEPQLALVHGGEMISPPGASGITNNFSISQLIVREEADIQRIARELYRMQQVRYG